MTVSRAILCTCRMLPSSICLRPVARMQPEEAVQSAVEEFGAQVTVKMEASCLCQGQGSERAVLQGVDLSGIIKTADGGNVEGCVLPPTTLCPVLTGYHSQQGDAPCCTAGTQSLWLSQP